MPTSKMSSNSSRSSRSPRQKKEILRAIKRRTEALEDSLTEETIQEFESCVQETEEINAETDIEEKVNNQEVVLLDSELMHMSSRVLKSYTRALKSHVSKYSGVEFGQKLVEYVKKLSADESEEPDWSLLEEMTKKYFTTTASYTTLLGTLTPLEKKEIKERKRVIRDPQSQIKKPEHVATVDKQEEGVELTEKVRKLILRIYKSNHKCVDFFQLVLNPDDFGKTVQNILQISFLVRDGQLKILKDVHGTLVIEPCSKDRLNQVRTGRSENIQNMLSLNMQQWMTLKRHYIGKPMIDFE